MVNLVGRIPWTATGALAVSLVLCGCEQWFRDPLALPGRDTQVVTQPDIADSILIVPSSTSARIFWRTVKPADAEVLLGTSPDILTPSGRDDRMLLSHAVTVGSLVPMTQYFVQARSMDPLGNTRTSAVVAFTTLSSSAVGTGKPDQSSRLYVSATFANHDPLPQQAVWIEDANGAYVRTLFVSRYAAAHYVLTEWWNASGGGSDAVSGATKQPGSYTFTWNCTDRLNVVVPAGTYRFRVETRSETAGSRTSCTGIILVGNNSQNATASPAGYCTALSAEYRP